MNLGNELISQRTVADYEALCATTIQRAEDAYRLLAQTREAAEKLDPYAMPSELSAYRLPELDEVKHKIWYTAWIKTF